MPRIAREHLLERGNGRIGASLLLEDHADVEIRRDQPRIERERALVSSQRVFAQMHHLQRDAVVVMRVGVGRQALQNLLEGRPRRNSIMTGELGEPQRPLQRQPRIFVGGQREARSTQGHGGLEISTLALKVCQRNPRLGIRRRGGHRGGKR